MALISLSCSYSGTPLTESTTTADLTKSEDGYRLRMINEFNLGDRIEEIFELPAEEPRWRALAHWFARDSDVWAGVGISEDHIDVYGVEAWQAEILALAWTRVEPERPTDAIYLIDLPDTWLESAADEMGGLERFWLAPDNRKRAAGPDPLEPRGFSSKEDPLQCARDYVEYFGQPTAPEQLLVDVVEELGYTQSSNPLLDATETACRLLRPEAERRSQLRPILRPIFETQ